MAEEVRCPECNGDRLYLDSRRAEIVCATCQTVVADRMPEEGGAPSADQPHQTGSDNRLLPQLFYSSRDTEGRIVASNTLWTLRQTAKLQNLKSAERSILNFEARLRQLAHQRNIPDSVVKRATDLYHRVRENRVFNKPNLTELALGLLLTACREMKHLMSLKDIAGTSGSVNKIKNYHYAILRSVGLAGPSDAINARLDEMSPVQYVIYYAAKLGVQQQGQMLTVAYNLSKIADGAAHCVGAASLFIALKNSGSEISQRDFCEQVNLSEISLRDWVAKLGGYDNARFVPSSVDPDQLDAGP